MSTILAALGGLGLLYGRLGAGRKTTVVGGNTGPGASTGGSLGLLLTLTQA